MSWLSDYLDKHGMKAVNDIARPFVNAADTIAHKIPVVGDVIDVGNAVGNMIPGTIYDGPGRSTGGGGNPSSDDSTDTTPRGAMPKTSVDYVNRLLQGSTGGDILNTIGRGIGGYMSNEQAQAALAQRKAEFDQTSAQRKAEYERTTGNSEATAAANAEQAINRAPLADKAQYQLMARMGIAPTAFKPRDYTQGLSNIASTPTGGYGDVLDTMGGAAKSYTTGAGGINTSALSLLQNRMLANAKSPAMPATTPARTPVAAPPVVTPPVGGAGTTTGAPVGTTYTPPVDVQNMQRRSKLQLDDEENPY